MVNSSSVKERAIAVVMVVMKTARDGRTNIKLTFWSVVVNALQDSLEEEEADLPLQ